MQTLQVLDDYEIRFQADGVSSLAGEVFYFRTSTSGQTLCFKVGKVSAHHAAGDGDAFRAHWKICLMFDDSFEYDAKNRVTVAPRMMERKHWERLGVEVSRGPLPKYAPSLPDAIVRKLVVAGFCAEPIWAQVYHGTLASVLDGYGDISYDD